MVPMLKGIPFSPQTALASNIGASDTVIPVLSITSFLSIPVPNRATIGEDENAETITYNAIAGNSLSGCIRGVEGIAKSWTSNTIIARNFTDADYEAIVENIKILDEKKAEKMLFYPVPTTLRHSLNHYPKVQIMRIDSGYGLGGAGGSPAGGENISSDAKFTYVNRNEIQIHLNKEITNPVFHRLNDTTFMLTSDDKTISYHISLSYSTTFYPVSATLKHNLNRCPVAQVIRVEYGAGLSGFGETPAGGTNITIDSRVVHISKNEILLHLQEELKNPVFYKVSNSIHTLVSDDDVISYQIFLF